MSGRSCKLCGKPIPLGIGNGNNLYCSRECKETAKSLRKYPNTCQYCGQEFESESYFKPYCSDECKLAARRRRSAEYKQAKLEADIRNGAHLRVVKYCVNCGREFTPKNASQKYCTDKCGEEYRKSCREALLNETRVCAYCGNEYTPKTLWQKYCSSKCQWTGRYECDYSGKREDGKSIRKCHDCGRPTTNYRCDKCWEKRRKGYLPEGETDNESYAILWK